MIITLHRKGHLEGTHPLQLNEPKSGQTEPSRPSLGNQLNRVFLIVPCAIRQNPCRGSLCWSVGVNSESYQQEKRPIMMKF